MSDVNLSSGRQTFPLKLKDLKEEVLQCSSKGRRCSWPGVVLADLLLDVGQFGAQEPAPFFPHLVMGGLQSKSTVSTNIRDPPREHEDELKPSSTHPSYLLQVP